MEHFLPILNEKFISLHVIVDFFHLIIFVHDKALELLKHSFK